MRGTFNVFQRTMLDWNRIHPYNAVHVARVPRPLDPDRLTGVVEGVMEESGLNGLVIDERRRHYEYRNVKQRYDIRAVSPQGSASEALEREIGRQLNEPFEHGGVVVPVRYFTVDEGEGFHLGLAYSHFVAGADSIVQLLRGIREIYLGAGRGGACLFSEHYPPGYCGGAMRRPGTVAGWVSTLPSSLRAVRRSYRPRYSDPDDQINGLKLFSLGESSLATLLQVSRRWGVTVNDLFMAVMLKVLSPHAAGRRTAARRRSISVASVANTRNDLGIPSQGVFGLFLGFLRVTHEVPDSLGMRDLAAEVHRQTAEIKAKRLYLRAALELAFGRFVRARMSPTVQRRFYSKYFPLWGGLTNVNLNRLWDAAGGEDPPDYIRAVSTGPVCPVVFAVTTVGRTIRSAVSYRRSAFCQEDVVDMIGRFTATVDDLGVDA